MTKDIVGYEELYFFNELGEIYSYPKKTRKGIRKLLPQKNKLGYDFIDLCKNGKVKKFLVHRLMAETYLENHDNKSQVNHINGVKNDNRLENLEWATRSENQKHAILFGLRTTKGVKNSQSKLTEIQVLSILEDKRTYGVISKEYNISVPTISDIKRGYSWTHITKLKNIKISKP
jgi:uncharacterized protein YerC